MAAAAAAVAATATATTSASRGARRSATNVARSRRSGVHARGINPVEEPRGGGA